MATVFIDLEPDEWIETSVTRRGYISNITDVCLLYVEAETLPDVSQVLGHQLYPHEVLKYILLGPGKVYMRSIREKGRIAVTPGITFYECCDTITPINYIFQNGENYVFQNGNNFEFN